MVTGTLSLSDRTSGRVGDVVVAVVVIVGLCGIMVVLLVSCPTLYEALLFLVFCKSSLAAAVVFVGTPVVVAVSIAGCDDDAPPPLLF